MKTYLVIGASSGIGKTLASQLVEKGNRVIGTYRTKKPQDTDKIVYHYYNAEELTSPAFLPEVLDGIVYCPGAIHLAPFHRIKMDQFKADFDLQVLGAIRTLQWALPALKKSPEASVVFFSTVAVQHGLNFHSQVAVSKGAIEGLTRSLAAEFAPKIRVNAVAPSLTDTPLAKSFLTTDEKRAANANRHPLKRIGQSEDIANTAAFLLSDQASWITGQVISVDGGFSAIK